MPEIKMRVAIDTSFLVGLLNPGDLWHPRAIALYTALLETETELLFFDCIVAEAISTATRRLQEKKDSAQLDTLYDALTTRVLVEDITWISLDLPRLYSSVIELMRSLQGILNFNDALIALACREREIPLIASFDADFDQIAWLRRVAQPKDLLAALNSTRVNDETPTEPG